MTAADVELRHYTHEDLADIRQTLLDVHDEVYADDMTEFRRRFPWFVDHWGNKPGFSCLIGYDHGEPVGYCYGAPAVPGREWWREFVHPAPEKTRTFAVSELMVRKPWRKTGTSRLLHHTLLADRDVDLAVLTVNTATPKVQKVYESWGYRKVGEQQPFPDSPLYAVMLAELPLAD